ncbi:hypothetical protein [Oxynema aestuarii]|jgi:hypothetical protein|uniref:Uncharacterized protein n=1 Tax=Oxynema aestuarii AP17 TaxID=2064643 RepID=A0A6H1TZT0_9CYAN|nr:hypothetical protein [Oxynema aestuarii]QIZ71657.1 hypothetical protein HCG48_14565 [Oxynema aestuarii AP17]RMH77947.1 MAG: hypothetical protein D6680_03615 [Cyanobacteria bacterium J007]
MTGFDLIILTFYLVCVVTVIARAIASLFVHQIMIRFDRPFLEKQLETQQLKGAIEIDVKLEKRYNLDEFKFLELKISNKSDRELYIDWDASAAIDLEGRSHRIVRIIPGMTLDLLSPQVNSVIPAKRTLVQPIASESSLRRNSESSPLAIARTFVDFSKLKPDRKDDKKKNRSQPKLEIFYFYLSLAFRFAASEVSTIAPRPIPLSCQFVVEPLPWTETLPWRQEKEKRK